MSKKQIWIIGLGFGGKRLVTRQESAALKMAQLYIGSGEAVEAAAEYAKSNGGRCVEADKPVQIRTAVTKAEEERIVIVTTEDPASSGELASLMPLLGDLPVYVFPGVPTSTYVSARVGVNAADAVVADLKSGAAGLALLLRRHPKVIVRSSKSLREELKLLARGAFRETQVFVCEHPAKDNEKLYSGRLFELAGRELSSDAICIFIRPPHMAGEISGAGEESFLSGKKGQVSSEIRAVVAGKLAVNPEDVVYVIGAGNGAIAIDAASRAERGVVCAVEADSEEIELLRKNCAREGANNVRIVPGEVPAALGHLPPANAVAICGQPESVVDLIQIVLSRNPDVRIVVLTETMEKATAAASQMEAKDLDTEFLQITSSKGKKVPGGHAMTPASTAFILTGRKKPRS